MADMRLHGKTVREIVDIAMKAMADKYGSLGKTGEAAADLLQEWVRLMDRGELQYQLVMSRSDTLVRELVYHRVVRGVCEDNDACMDYVMERLEEAKGATVEHRAEDLAKEYFDTH